MAKTIKGLFGGVSNKQQNIQQYQQQQERIADQSRILNDRNSALESETRAAGAGRRGRRLLAYQGKETGLRDRLGV